jgi:4-hydroxybenzoate polyprenyltransferase
MEKLGSDRASALEIDHLDWGTARDWGQLVRLPNVFTLISNCLAAAVVATGNLLPITAFVPTLAASLCAYWAGMILNDVVDLEEDRRDRPSRPLAAGKISPVIAGHVATGMLLIGPILIMAVATFHKTAPLWMGFSFALAVVLSVCVRMYNSALKSTPLGPFLMGGCRSLNILMVGSTMFAVSGNEVFPRAVLYLAAGIGLYIVGVTIYAHREEKESAAGGLVVGLILEIAGLVLIGFLPRWVSSEVKWTLDPNGGYPLLIALIGLTVLNRGFAGVLHPVSRKVQLAVKHAILTLIFVDAAVVVMWAGPWYGGAVALLLLPALASAVRFRST